MKYVVPSPSIFVPLPFTELLIIEKRRNMNKVLIVDDFPDNIFLLQEIVELIGFSAESRENGEQAVDAVRHNNYTVVFMDIEMPVMNGFEAAEEIRTILTEPSCSVPIIAISAHSHQFFEDKLNKVGFNDYISKPYTLEKVKRSLQKLNLML